MISSRWSVYMHTNKINDKKYIGITSLKPNYRWRNGKGYKPNTYFYNAIDKYGWDNFRHEILYKNLSKEDAENYEKELIEKYNTRNDKYGYNIAFGGYRGNLGLYNNIKMSMPVYQYDLNGNFISEYPSMMEAERITGVDNSMICACCKSKIGYICNYIWSYEKTDKITAINVKEYLYDKVIKEQCKEVFQYDLDGNFIKKYNSLSESSKCTNIDFRNISTCCLGKRNTAGGYVFAYKKYDNINDLKNRKIDNIPKGKSVIQYDKNNNKISEFISIMDAVRKTGISKGKISRCCNSKVEYADGYIFRFN